MSLWRRVYTERRGIVLPLLLFLVANVAVLILMVWPLRQSVARAADDKFNAVAGLGSARQSDNEARTAQARMESADVELGAFYEDVLPRSLSEARNLLVFELIEVATSTGVVFNGSSSDYDAVRDSRLVKVSNTATLRGQYQNVLRFLYALETADQFVIIERVELAQPTVTQQGSGGVLELLVDVATYYLPPATGATAASGAAPAPAGDR